MKKPGIISGWGFKQKPKGSQFTTAAARSAWSHVSLLLKEGYFVIDTSRLFFRTSSVGLLCLPHDLKVDMHRLQHSSSSSSSFTPPFSVCELVPGHEEITLEWRGGNGIFFSPPFFFPKKKNYWGQGTRKVEQNHGDCILKIHDNLLGLLYVFSWKFMR